MIMSNRYILPVLGALLLLLNLPYSTSAQQTQVPAASAKQEALISAGIMHDPASGAEMVAHAIYVKLRPGRSGMNSPATAAKLATEAGVRVVSATPLAFSRMPLDKGLERRLQSLPGERQRQAAAAEENLSRIVELHFDGVMSPVNAARIMARLPDVEYAEPIILPYPLGGAAAPPNDPMVQEEFQLSLVKLLDAWEVWKGDSNMVIGIVDAGVDMFHEDLAPNIKENPGEVGLDAQSRDKRTNGVDDDGNGVVDDWRGANLTYDLDGTEPGNTFGSSHGTEVSGLAAAKTNNGIGIAGAGYNTMFFPVKTASTLASPLVRAYDGIIYCARRGFKVINCSFGSEFYSQVLEDLLMNLTLAYDCAIVAGAGNTPIYGSFYPAGYRSVLGVGAIDKENVLRTTWGEQVGISSTAGFSTGNNGAYYELGPATSYATPVVSGIVALVRSRYPDLSALQALAHVRLASDPIYPPTPDMAKLTGYGRVNALKAVTTDPFSHPAISIDSLWLTDDAGNARDRIPVGGTGRMMFRLKNILGPASNISVRVIAYREDSTVVSISTVPATMASLGTEESKVIETGVPFEVREANSSRVRLRFEITADGYSDYQYERVLFYLPYITVRTSEVSLTLTDRGRLGFEDYPENTIGTGIVYQGRPFLFEGGLIIARDRSHLLSNIRGASSNEQESDFSTVEYPSELNNGTLTLSDAPAGSRRVGLEVRIRPFTLDTVPEGVGIEVRTKNLTPGLIDTLRLAYFTDWDMDSIPYRQSVGYVARPGEKVPFYGRLEDNSSYYIAHGVAGPAPYPIFFALRNDSLPVQIGDGFTSDEKWTTVSNGVGSTTAVAGTAGDISLVIGKRIVNLPAFGEDTTLFVIGFSSFDFGDATRTMNRMAPNPAGGVGGVSDRPALPGMLLGEPHPNPFRSVTLIEIDPGIHDATLRVYDAAGRMVADLTDRIGRSGGRVRFDGSSLPDGVYRVQLVSARGSDSQQLVLIR